VPTWLLVLIYVLMIPVMAGCGCVLNCCLEKRKLRHKAAGQATVSQRKYEKLGLQATV
jgi:hypothetical protein